MPYKSQLKSFEVGIDMDKSNLQFDCAKLIILEESWHWKWFCWRGWSLKKMTTVRATWSLLAKIHLEWIWMQKCSFFFVFFGGGGDLPHNVLSHWEFSATVDQGRKHAEGNLLWRTCRSVFSILGFVIFVQVCDILLYLRTCGLVQLCR